MEMANVKMIRNVPKTIDNQWNGASFRKQIDPLLFLITWEDDMNFVPLLEANEIYMKDPAK